MDKYQAILKTVTPEARKKMEEYIKTMEESANPKVRDLGKSMKD